MFLPGETVSSGWFSKVRVFFSTPFIFKNFVLHIYYCTLSKFRQAEQICPIVLHIGPCPWPGSCSSTSWWPCSPRSTPLTCAQCQAHSSGRGWSGPPAGCSCPPGG